MHKDAVTIVDDFFEAPLAVRAQALKQEYLLPRSQVDKDALGPIANFTGCDQATQDLVNSKVRPLLPRDIARALIEFRYCHENTVKRQACHADGTDFAGVVYLTLPEHCQGGTRLFTHRPTGDRMFKPNNSHLYNYRSGEEWEAVYDAPMAFNRLALYPGRLFHAIATPYFGTRVENARLTLVFFIDLIGSYELQEHAAHS